MLDMVALAVAVNVAVMAPEVTATETGTVRRVLFDPSVTVEPPVGAICVRVTVHVLVPACPRVVGLHATLETSTGASRLIVAVWELLPSVAAIVAL